MTPNDGKSNIKVSISKDKLTAWISTPDVDGDMERELINQELARAGVIFGILNDEIDNFILYPSKEPAAVARGIPPTPGKDESVELFFDSELSSSNQDEMDTVDFRETSTLISLNEGDLLARKHPAITGSDGIGVTGEVLPPLNPKYMQLVAGKGAQLAEDGSEAYTTISGRPWAKVSGQSTTVGCESLYVQSGDVDIKTGNLRFKGDVRITGNVQEAMEVQSPKCVEIMGYVTRATVTSGEKLIIRGNVISSKLKAGIIFSGAKKINFMLADVYAELNNMGKAIEQLKKMQNVDLSKMDFGRLLLGLMDSRFKNIRPLLKNIQSFMETQNEELPEEVATAVNSLKFLSNLSHATQDNFGKAMKSVYHALESLSQSREGSDCAIIVRAAMNSTLQSAGTVSVTGQGCLNTIINAGGNVVLKGSFKGGEILSEGNAEIQELGSELGMPPVVRVGEKKYVTVGKAYAGAVIQVGKNRITLTKEMTNFKAKLNKDGQLELL